MVVGHGQMNLRTMARRRQRVEPFLRAAGQRHGRRTRFLVHDTYIAHEHAALEAGAHRLGEGLLGGETLRVGAGAGEGAAFRLGALDVGEDALGEAVAEAVERILDPLDVAQVRADADDRHRAASISRRMWATLSSRPQKIASPIRKWPMFSSRTCGMAATGWTLSKLRPWPACGSMPFLAARAAASAMRRSSA